MIPAKSGRIFCDVLIRVAVWITLTSKIFVNWVEREGNVLHFVILSQSEP